MLNMVLLGQEQTAGVHSEVKIPDPCGRNISSQEGICLQ